MSGRVGKAAPIRALTPVFNGLWCGVPTRRLARVGKIAG
jgi:hypothetical protein